MVIIFTVNDSKTYRKKSDQYVIAVQLALDTEGFEYEKWGSSQRCKAKDWVVYNVANQETYTIDNTVFQSAYVTVDSGKYAKVGLVTAKQALQDGSVKTKEGITEYKRGDYLVTNEGDGSDVYAISADKFALMYELVDG